MALASMIHLVIASMHYAHVPPYRTVTYLVLIGLAAIIVDGDAGQWIGRLNHGVRYRVHRVIVDTTYDHQELRSYSTYYSRTEEVNKLLGVQSQSVVERIL